MKKCDWELRIIWLLLTVLLFGINSWAGLSALILFCVAERIGHRSSTSSTCMEALVELGFDGITSMDKTEGKYEIVKRAYKHGYCRAILESFSKYRNHKDAHWERIFVPYTCEKSIVVWIVAFFSNFLKLLVPLYWYGFFFKRKRKTNECCLQKLCYAEINLTGIEVELWVFLLIILEVMALRFSEIRDWNHFSFWVAIYGLINILGVTFDELLEPIKREAGYVPIRNASRWLILTGINVFQIILCFSILINSYGYQFVGDCGSINEWDTALYQSFVTFTTLGYGEYVPICLKSRTIVIAEVCFFLLMIGFKLPMAISVIKVRVKERD